MHPPLRGQAQQAAFTQPSLLRLLERGKLCEQHKSVLALTQTACRSSPPLPAPTPEKAHTHTHAHTHACTHTQKHTHTHTHTHTHAAV
jgi:hypothetical protein